MRNLFSEFMENESGLILSAELILILTIGVIGIIVGLVQVQTAINSEFQDLALAFSSLNQSYMTASFFGCRKFWGATSWTAGSGYIDYFNGCVGNANWGGSPGGFNAGVGGFGGGYAEIGGGGYYSSGSTTPAVVNPQPAACETCPTESATGNGTMLPTPEASHLLSPTPTPVPVTPTPSPMK